MGILFGKTNTHKIKTYTKGSYVNGEWVEGIPTTYFLTADIQPVTGKELETLSIGTRNLGKIKIYTNTILKIRDEGNNQSGDVVEWNGDGENYEVIGIENRDNNIINHRKYYGELRKRNTN